MTDPRTSRLGAVNVLAVNKEKILLGCLWAERPVLLTMIRHFG